MPILNALQRWACVGLYAAGLIDLYGVGAGRAGEHMPKHVAWHVAPKDRNIAVQAITMHVP